MKTLIRSIGVGGMLAVPLVILLLLVLTRDDAPADFIRSFIYDFSDSNSVPADKRHIEDAIAAPPDDAKGNPNAQNFTQAGEITESRYRAATQAFDTRALGGFGSSDNAARKVSEDCQGSGLYLIAQPGVERSQDGRPGMRLLLVNRTASLLAFGATDSRLDIVQEAKNAEGNWLPIESMPSLWCGNSHHSVFLGPDYFWEFSAPRYEGLHTTKLRFALRLPEDTMVYSNEFDGSVNPGQFAREE